MQNNSLLSTSKVVKALLFLCAEISLECLSFSTLSYKPHSSILKTPRSDGRLTLSNTFVQTTRSTRVFLSHESKLYSTPDDSLFSQETLPLSVIKPTGITLKMAFDNSSLWGVADDAEEKSERFTSPSSLDLVHRLRRVSDCVLVGRGTVERDDCTLTVRRVPLLEGQIQPVRVVIDPNLRLLEAQNDDEDEDDGYAYKMLKDGLPAIVYHSSSDETKSKNDSETVSTKTCGKEGKVTLVDVNCDNEGNQISPQTIIKDLASRNIHHVMVEGGPATALSFLREKAVDRAIIIKAPIAFKEPVLSHMTEHTLIGAGLEKLGSAESDGDIVEYWSKQGLPWPVDNNFAAWP